MFTFVIQTGTSSTIFSIQGRKLKNDIGKRGPGKKLLRKKGKRLEVRSERELGSWTGSFVMMLSRLSGRMVSRSSRSSNLSGYVLEVQIYLDMSFVCSREILDAKIQIRLL